MTGGRRDNPHESVWTDLPTLPPVFSSAGTGSDEFLLEHHRQPAFELPPLSATVYGVSVTLSGTFRAEVTVDGRGRRFSLRRGDVSVFPYGFSIEGARVGACEFLLLWLRPSMIERAAAGVLSAGRPEITPRLGVADPLAAAMLNDLLRDLKTEPDNDSPGVDTILSALSLHLVRHYSAPSRSVREHTGGMSDYVLSTAIDFIDDSLGRDLSVDEIALAAGLSPSRFARAFKAATGKAVRQYVDERRVETAKALLTDGDLPLGEVARRVGFRNPRRLAAAFRKLTGVSPQSYRQQTRP